MDAQQRDAAQQKVFDLVKSIEVAQMVTIGADGRMRSRPMVAQQDAFAGELWFLTSATSGKLDELEANREVLLTYSDPAKQNYVSIEGDGELVSDAQKVRAPWKEPMRVWFPKGPTDSDIALVRMREARYWDAHRARSSWLTATSRRLRPGSGRTLAMSARSRSTTGRKGPRRLSMQGR